MYQERMAERKGSACSSKMTHIAKMKKCNKSCQHVRVHKFTYQILPRLVVVLSKGYETSSQSTNILRICFYFTGTG